ncbi:MAG: Fur family transcriptional regulator [Phycisphaerales bacterium JB060]
MTRDTRQRRAIRSVFLDADGPLGPQEVLDRAQADVPGIGLATIYRTIKLMLEDQELKAVDLPGEPARYEPADRTSHHHFFKCDDCGRVYEVQGCVSNPAGLAPDGFRVSRHEIVLYGTCAACA